MSGAQLLADGTDVMQAGSEYRYFVGVAYELADDPPRYEVEAAYEPRLPAYPSDITSAPSSIWPC